MTILGLCGGIPRDMAAPIHYPPSNGWGQLRARCVVSLIRLVLKVLPKRRYWGASVASGQLCLC